MADCTRERHCSIDSAEIAMYHFAHLGVLRTVVLDEEVTKEVSDKVVHLQVRFLNRGIRLPQVTFEDFSRRTTPGAGAPIPHRHSG